MHINLFIPHHRSAEGEAMQRFGSKESQDQINGRTFVEVIRERYSPENFPWCRGPDIRVVVVPPGPQGSPVKGESGFVKSKDKVI